MHQAENIMESSGDSTGYPDSKRHSFHVYRSSGYLLYTKIPVNMADYYENNICEYWLGNSHHWVNAGGRAMGRELQMDDGGGNCNPAFCSPGTSRAHLLLAFLEVFCTRCPVKLCCFCLLS